MSFTLRNYFIFSAFSDATFGTLAATTSRKTQGTSPEQLLPLTLTLTHQE